MVSAMTNTHHAIDYIELPAADLSGTRAFYEQAFGWQFNEYGPEYAGIRSPSGDGEVGGLDGTAGPDRRAPLVLLYSDDLDASVAAVTAAGGTHGAGALRVPRRPAVPFHRPERHGTGRLVELMIGAISRAR